MYMYTVHGPEFTLSLTIIMCLQHLNIGQMFRSSMYRNVTQSELRHLIMWLEYLELGWLRNRGGSCHSCLVQRWSHWPDRPGPHSLCWEWDYQWCTWCLRSEEMEGGREGDREGEERREAGRDGGRERGMEGGRERSSSEFKFWNAEIEVNLYPHTSHHYPMRVNAQQG